MCKIRQRDRDFILTVIILKGKKTKKINREKASKRNDVLSFALAQRSATYLEMLLTLSTMAVHSCYWWAGSDITKVPRHLIENHLADRHLADRHLADRRLADAMSLRPNMTRRLTSKSYFKIHRPNVCRPKWFFDQKTWSHHETSVVICVTRYGRDHCILSPQRSSIKDSLIEMANTLTRSCVTLPTIFIYPSGNN